AVIAGAAIGDRVRVDVRSLWYSLRRSRRRWVPVGVVAAAIPFAGAAAANALQNGPIGSLYSYRDPARAAGPVGARQTVQVSRTGWSVTSSPRSMPGTAPEVPSSAASPG